MAFFKNQVVRIGFFAIVLLPLIFTSGCGNEQQDLDLSMYEYRDTRNLVKFVYGAATILEKDGEAGFDYFKGHRELFRTPEYYLYIYDMNGKNAFHAGMPELEGKNLIGITDINGKKAVQLLLDSLQDKNNPHAWVHYFWWEPGKFYAVPKSSCHFKATTPEGNTYCVGGGMNYPHEEKEFIRIVVDDAVDLIRSKGMDALPEIADPTQKYTYRDVRVFAFRANGELLISPVINNQYSQIKLLECVDEVGKKPFADALEKLRTSDRTWEVFMAKNRYRRNLVKKCLYLRKVTVGEQEILVGAITDLPQPSCAK